MIESMEENWDVTYIMASGQIRACVRRDSLKPGESLEDVFFEITEGHA
jgi:hypothetical protein